MKKKIVKVLRIIGFGFCIPFVAISERVEKPKMISRIKNKPIMVARGFIRPADRGIEKTVVKEC